MEDTLDEPLPTFRSTPIPVRARRLRIGDIVQRCLDAENAARSRIDRYEATVLSKMIAWIGPESDPDRQLVSENVEKMIWTPERERVLPLKREQYILKHGEREPWDDDAAISIGYRDFNDLPFYLEDVDDYRFEIRSREIVDDRVIYEVALEPKSDFEIAPKGVIWIDSTEFRILREEFEFGDRVPMPLFVKSVGPFVRERVRIGDTWAWSRFLIRVELRMGYLRFLEGNIPDGLEMQVEFRDVEIHEKPIDIDRDAGAPADGEAAE
ncbi:MAG: hypothetical protein R3B81_07660 [bacterium]